MPARRSHNSQFGEGRQPKASMNCSWQVTGQLARIAEGRQGEYKNCLRLDSPRAPGCDVKGIPGYKTKDVINYENIIVKVGHFACSPYFFEKKK